MLEKTALILINGLINWKNSNQLQYVWPSNYVHLCYKGIINLKTPVEWFRGNLLHSSKDSDMNKASENASSADFYLGILSNLNAESKLDLISKLSQSLKKNYEDDMTSLQSLFGAYQSEETAEKIIAELRASRSFNRKIESL